jgi:hypothetical protein
MAETIDAESRKSVQLVTDLDRQRRKYVVQNGNVKVQFVAPAIFNYERFFFYLLRNSSYGQLNKKYFYRPDYLSYDEYGTTTLWALILFINKVKTIEQFIGPKVYIPTYNSILEISKYDQELVKPVDVDELNAPNENIKKLQVYYSKVRIPQAT